MLTDQPAAAAACLNNLPWAELIQFGHHLVEPDPDSCVLTTLRCGHNGSSSPLERCCLCAGLWAAPAGCSMDAQLTVPWAHRQLSTELMVKMSEQPNTAWQKQGSGSQQACPGIPQHPAPPPPPFQIRGDSRAPDGLPKPQAAALGSAQPCSSRCEAWRILCTWPHLWR